MTSKIKVDNIENQCGGAVVTKCGATTTISGSVVKADDIQAADGGNLINQCGTTITLGASGDTINLASGASQTGFGRTGTVDWDTTAKTASFTAVSGNGYFVNTTSGTITVTLPAGSAGDIVSLADYAATWQTNNVTVTPNGTDKIGSQNENATLATEGQSVTFVYVDSTQGWINTMDSTSNVRGAPPFITATGGTETTCGNFKIHTFTGPGTFTINNTAICASDNALDYLVVAGGGGAGYFWGAGGGAGGARMSAGTSTGCYTVGPLGSGVSTLTASVQGYPITVGSGGSGGPPASGNGVQGSNSIFSSITSTGGGYGAGGSPPAPVTAGGPGGSGGGMGSPNTGSGGTGNTPPVSPPQGQPGGPAGNPGAGGGGGATAAGGAASPGPGTGGTGVANNINSTTGQPCGANRYYAGGGGGDAAPGAYKPGGLGGGGMGPSGPGTANTGGGGGSDGGSGGSGVVVIRYKYQ